MATSAITATTMAVASRPKSEKPFCQDRLNRPFGFTETSQDAQLLAMVCTVSVEAANPAWISEIHPHKEGPADDVLIRDKAPVA